MTSPSAQLAADRITTAAAAFNAIVSTAPSTTAWPATAPSS